MVPHAALELAEELKSSLDTKGANALTELLAGRVPKFEVTQAARYAKGKITSISPYNPFELFQDKDNALLRKALSDIVGDYQSYGKFRVDGVEKQELSTRDLDVIVAILRQTEVLRVVKNLQAIDEQGIDSVAAAYEALGGFIAEGKVSSEQVYAGVKSQLLGLDKESILLSAKKGDLGTFENVLSRIVLFIVSATAKDFTLMFKYTDYAESDGPLFGPDERVIKLDDGTSIVVQLGLLDLDTKLFSKIPTYLKEYSSSYRTYLETLKQ